MTSSNAQYHKGQLVNGFDYDLQVWVKQGVVLNCGHPGAMSKDGYYCCNARKYGGEEVTSIKSQLGL